MNEFIKNLKKELEEIRKNRPDYVPFKECRGFLDWFSKNEGTRQRDRFEYILSVLVSIITSFLMTMYLLKK